MLRILCLLLLPASLYGQTPSVLSPVSGTLPMNYPSQRTTADTIKALHLLFSNKRVVGGLLLGLGGTTLLALPSLFVSSGPPKTSYGNLGEFLGGVQVALSFGTPILALGAIQLSRNSKQNEEQAIHLYLEKRALPRRLRRKLRPELFLRSPPPLLTTDSLMRQE